MTIYGVTFVLGLLCIAWGVWMLRRPRPPVWSLQAPQAAHGPYRGAAKGTDSQPEGMRQGVVIFAVRDGYLVGTQPSPDGAHICGPLITSLEEAERQAVRAKEALRQYDVRRRA